MDLQAATVHVLWTVFYDGIVYTDLSAPTVSSSVPVTFRMKRTVVNISVVCVNCLS